MAKHSNDGATMTGTAMVEYGRASTEGHQMQGSISIVCPGDHCAESVTKTNSLLYSSRSRSLREPTSEPM